MYEYDPFSLIQRSLTVEKNTKIHIRSSSARRRKLTPLVSLIRSTKTFIAPYCTRYPTLTMKLFAAVITASLAITQAFVVSPSYASTSTQLNAVAPLDRRGLLSNAAALAVGSVLVAAPGTALAEYVPKFDDMKQIYILGVSLDRLADRLSNPDTVELGLDGVRQFNKNPGFYPGYAKNFIMKSVPKGSDSDPRVGYVKQVSSERKKRLT